MMSYAKKLLKSANVRLLSYSKNNTGTLFETQCRSHVKPIPIGLIGMPQ